MKYEFPKALALATLVHAHQLDHSGDPYLWHIIRVVHRVWAATAKSPVLMRDRLMAIAALHDVLEDTPVTLEELKEKFPVSVWGCVASLTHMQGESYHEYIPRVGKDEWSKLVKIADLEDHLARPGAEKFPKYKTYVEALEFLKR
jgi:(p)ppGpp synthase/HD superfamily hydrolase